MKNKLDNVRRAYSDLRVPTKIVGDSRTKQSFKDEVNINKIMTKYKQTGFLNPALIKQADYMDVDGMTFQDAMNIVISAQDQFDSLPADLRKQFNNSPSQFLDFVKDEKNIDQMVEMGLIDSPENYDFGKQKRKTSVVSKVQTREDSGQESADAASPPPAGDDK
jgi:phage internal scaffolding protein